MSGTTKKESMFSNISLSRFIAMKASWIFGHQDATLNAKIK